MHKISIYLLALATLTSLLVAQTPPDTGVKQFPPQSTAIGDVLVPVPSEIFNTLDKFAHSNWRAVQRPELAQWRPHGEQTEIALLLGVVIAEGFIAVEAEDAAEVKSIGRAVLALARGLGVERAALRRSRSIVEHAEKGDWPAVRKEWDGVLPDVQQGMKELKSEQHAQLVSLGGWLRGTEVLTALVLKNYSLEDRASAATCAARLLREAACGNERRHTNQSDYRQDARGHTKNPTASRIRRCANLTKKGEGDRHRFRRAPQRSQSQRPERLSSRQSDRRLGAVAAAEFL